MLLGIFACLLLIAIGHRAWVWLQVDVIPGKELVACLIAGAVGATVSVMSRMTFGELSLDYEAGR